MNRTTDIMCPRKSYASFFEDYDNRTSQKLEFLESHCSRKNVAETSCRYHHLHFVKTNQ